MYDFIVFGNSIINIETVRNFSITTGNRIICFSSRGEYIDSETYDSREEAEKALTHINDIVGGKL